jgi:tetratricopeptide (TPR) repeat protein
MSRRLETIRDTAIEGDCDTALAELQNLLKATPEDIQALRLKGNVLEMRALDRAQYSSQKLVRSRDYIDARLCYEKILALDPDNTLALIDLGDHYRHLGAFGKATTFYERAIVLLSKGKSSWSRRDEAEEVFERTIQLYRELGKDADAERLARARTKLLRSIRTRTVRRSQAGTLSQCGKSPARRKRSRR